MLSDKRNILQLVALMHAHGISDVVLCPGSRNAPICHTISQTGLFTCHRITDERSAGFFAIGLALATERTVAVCVTSGSALLNVHPAVAEAYYQQVPLLVISADRPAEWIGQMDGQTMPQPGALGKMAKMCANLPEPHTKEEEWHVNRLINEALLECHHRTKGPVHINVPISEPLYNFPTTTLPQERVIHRIEGLYTEPVREMSSLLKNSKKPMIIIGQSLHTLYEDGNTLGEHFVILQEHLANSGNIRHAIRISDDLLTAIPTSETALYCPDLVITIGGHIINKKLKQMLRKYQPAQHWHVSADGSVADLFCCLTTVIEAQPTDFMKTLNGQRANESTSQQVNESTRQQDNKTTRQQQDNGQEDYETRSFVNRWKELEGKKHTAENMGNTCEVCQEQACVGMLLSMLPENAVLHLANSSSVRYAQHYPIAPTITVCCNRGINGIEGSLSSAVGYATATPTRPNFVIIGDLSFFYDQNALWNRQLPNNLHILLLNNGGGKIFQTLPVPEDEKSRSIICAHHNTHAHSVAEQYGLRYFNGIEKISAFIESDESALLECIF